MSIWRGKGKALRTLSIDDDADITVQWGVPPAPGETPKPPLRGEPDPHGDDFTADEIKHLIEEWGEKYLKKRGKEIDIEKIAKRRKEAKYELPKMPTRMFKKRIRDILMDNKLKREVGNKQYGTLDHKKLFKIGTTGKVFKRKDRESERLYNVCLLVDCSGSMGHTEEKSRSAVAAESAAMLVRDLEDIVNIEVAGFNMDNYVFKPYGKKVDAQNIMTQIHYWTGHDSGCGNHDGDALRTVYKRISKLRGKNIIIVLSDGQPACDEGCAKCNDIDLLKDLKKTTASIERSPTELLAVGIQTTSVDMFYAHRRKIEALPELYPAVLSLLKDRIRRRRL